MTHETVIDGVVRERWDDTTRTYTAYDENGDETSSRPYTDAENTRADTAATDAQKVADAQARLAQQSALLTATLATAAPPPDGQPWVQPTGPADAYPAGATVTHAGKTWTSLVDFNVWEPPANWREVSAGGCPEFVQPTGASDAYNTGDCVSFDGACYTSAIDANVWSPAAYPAGWNATPCP